MTQTKSRLTTSLLRSVTSFTFLIYLASLSVQAEQEKPHWQWDFDHKVNYKKVALKNNRYLLEIMPKNKTSFDQMATFMFRKSYAICNNNQYTLKVLKGVQSFNDVQGSPNKIMSSFKTKIICSAP